jgi:hypothetical protein
VCVARRRRDGSGSNSIHLLGTPSGRTPYERPALPLESRSTLPASAPVTAGLPTNRSSRMVSTAARAREAQRPHRPVPRPRRRLPHHPDQHRMQNAQLRHTSDSDGLPRHPRTRRLTTTSSHGDPAAPRGSGVSGHSGRFSAQTIRHDCPKNTVVWHRAIGRYSVAPLVEPLLADLAKAADN